MFFYIYLWTTCISPIWNKVNFFSSSKNEILNELSRIEINLVQMNNKTFLTYFRWKKISRQSLWLIENWVDIKTLQNRSTFIFLVFEYSKITQVLKSVHVLYTCTCIREISIRCSSNFIIDCICWCYMFQGSEGTQDRSFIRNKIGQIISLAFVQDYPHRWPSFFTDLLQTVSPNHHSIDIYLRVLLAIDSDVVDREIVHTAEVISYSWFTIFIMFML